MSLSTTAKVTLAAAGIVILGVAAYSLLTLSDEDREPIRVKNKALVVEVNDANWTDENGSKKKWKPKHAQGKNTTEYTVTAYGANAGCLAAMKGVTAKITYATNDASADPRTFTFGFAVNPNNNKSEPVLDTSYEMSEDNSKKSKKLVPAQLPDVEKWAITELVVTPASGSSTTCTFDGDTRVLVEVCMQNCQ